MPPVPESKSLPEEGPIETEHEKPGALAKPVYYGDSIHLKVDSYKKILCVFCKRLTPLRLASLQQKPF